MKQRLLVTGDARPFFPVYTQNQTHEQGDHLPPQVYSDLGFSKVALTQLDIPNVPQLGGLLQQTYLHAPSQWCPLS